MWDVKWRIECAIIILYGSRKRNQRKQWSFSLPWKFCYKKKQHKPIFLSNPRKLSFKREFMTIDQKSQHSKNDNYERLQWRNRNLTNEKLTFSNFCFNINGWKIRNTNFSKKITWRRDRDVTWFCFISRPCVRRRMKGRKS